MGAVEHARRRPRPAAVGASPDSQTSNSTANNGPRSEAAARPYLAVTPRPFRIRSKFQLTEDCTQIVAEQPQGKQAAFLRIFHDSSRLPLAIIRRANTKGGSKGS